MGVPVSSLTPEKASRLRDTAKICGLGLLLYGAVALAGSIFTRNEAGGAAVQAVIAELGAGRLAIAWSDPDAEMPTAKAIGFRLVRGAGMGFAAAVFVLVSCLATRAVTIVATPPSGAQLLVGLVMACLVAMREELLLRGIVFRMLGRAAPSRIVLCVCGLAGAAARVGTAAPEETVAELAGAALIAGLASLIFAALWRRDRGAWLAWGAHVAWLWAMGTLTRGGLVDVRWNNGAWGGGPNGFEGSAAVGASLTVIAGVAIAWSSLRKRGVSAASLG